MFFSTSMILLIIFGFFVAPDLTTTILFILGLIFLLGKCTGCA